MSISSCATGETEHRHSAKNRVLTCTICLEIFVDPKILPCFHTFCKKCLWTHVMTTAFLERFPCPLCRTEISLPGGGVDSFQGNFYIQEIAELVKQESDAMKRTTIINSCRKTTESRRDNLQKYLVYPDLYCPTHARRKEWVVSYCTRCRMPICLQCKLHEHAGHEWEVLGVVVDRAQNELMALDQRLRRTQKYLAGLIEDRHTYMSTFCEQFSRVSDQIRANAENIKSNVDSRCEALTMLLDHLKVTEANKIETHKTQVMECTKSLTEVKQVVDRMLKGSNVLNLLASTAHLREQADDAISQIPGEIDKCLLVYDRRNTDNLGQKIEDAMGYLSCQRNPSIESEMDTSTDHESQASQTLDPPRQDYPQRGHISAIRLIQKIAFNVCSKNAAVKFIVSVPSMGTLIGYNYDHRQIDVVSEVGTLTQVLEAAGSTSCASLIGQTSLALCSTSPRQLTRRCLPQFTTFSDYTDIPIIPTAMAVRNLSELLICGRGKSGVETGIYKFRLESNDLLAVYTNGDLHVLKAPCSVTVTHDGDREMFVVADNKKKSVFYFDTDGELLHTFPSQRCSFCPEGICSDQYGDIVVADKGNNSVVVLSPRGAFKREIARCVNPRVVAFDEYGRLWIGQSDGSVTINEYSTI